MRELLSGPNVEDLYEGLRGLLEELIARLSPVAVLVAGSLARGEFVRGMSDIDILILVREAPSDEERFSLASVGGVDVEMAIYGVDEVLMMAREGSFFILDALENGAVIYGRLPEGLRAFRRTGGTA